MPIQSRLGRRDPRDYAVGTLKDTYAKYDIGDVLPAMGYSDQQLKDMEQMVNSVPADVVVIASPIDLRHLLDIQKPAVRVVYDLVEEPGSPTIADALKKVL